VFLHQKGIYSDKELKKVDSAIEEFSVPLMEIYERQAWKYGFLDGWGIKVRKKKVWSKCGKWWKVDIGVEGLGVDRYCTKERDNKIWYISV